VNSSAEHAASPLLRVLMVEDQDDDAQLIVRELKRAGFAVEPGRAHDAATLRAAIEDGQWDVVLSDHILPGFGSQEAFEILRDAGVDAPFIIVSGRIGEETVAEALRGGASEYVNKDHLETLAPAVRRSLRTAQAVRSQQAAEAALRESQARLQSLLDHAPLPLSLRDLDGRFLLLNRVAADLIGDTVENLLGRPPEELDDPEVASRTDDQERTVRAGQGAVTFEMTAPHPDGSEDHYIVTKYPVTDSEGRLTGVGGISLDVTERRRAELALHESEEATRAIIEHADDAFISADPGGRITAWNPAAERMFGWAAREVLGRAIADVLVPPELRAAHEAGLARLSVGEAPRMIGRRIELSALHRDGRRLLVETTISRVTRSGADVFQTFMRDVTEQRLAQGRVQEAEERFRLAFDNAPIGIALVSPEGRFLRVNNALTGITGYSAGVLLETTFQDITHPDDLDADLDYVRRILAGEIQTYEMEKRYVRADRSIVWILLSVSLVRDADGQPRYLIAQIQDIDRRKRADAKFAGLLESAPEAIVGVNAEGRIVLINAQAESLFGYPRHELLGRSVDLLVPEAVRHLHPKHRSDYIADPHHRPMGARMELAGRRRDGTVFPAEISLSAIETEDGVIVSAAVRDVTDRKRIEQQLREKNIELEKAIRAKDMFLASMSHELRTPLNAINGFTGTLLMQLPGPLNDEQKRQLRTVQNNGKHLLSIINDLLDLAKIESGEVHLELEQIDCSAIVQEVLRSLQPLADERGLDLSLRVPAEPVMVRSEARALSQILINLVNNAIKFTDAGSVHIDLNARDGDRPACIRVTDTGRGISQADRPRVFLAFNRGKDQAGGRQEGTGLGLHISKKLAELINAEISLESEPGQGSTFTVTLRD
jgi:PAS domain S-box-containing protein